MKKIGLFIFDHDLRVLDNPALKALADSVDTLICLYVHAPQDAFSQQFSQTQPSSAKLGFLQQHLVELDENLRLLNQF